jgi:hypothetical protein
MLKLVNPLVALIFGIVVLAEHPSGSPMSLALECLGLILTLVGIFMLGRTRIAEPDVAGADPARGRIGPGTLSPQAGQRPRSQA